MKVIPNSMGDALHYPIQFAFSFMYSKKKRTIEVEEKEEEARDG